ncbi:three-Cys-motif partner protein TcmP [Allomuricauda sp. F6463D]|uniref:three-Cys-motif partner protein TcmP n=1 Tax=Allomuricauda sp. F6463D TaxID=2926409 RepID=UPI001FF6473C|nr:three-Cys-motif partner protein TcmP [Muricauda sp. F6463D]MCK0159669.1 three-Cys-motif partner protein TcmP [Muricauda sp. F6463D]
MSEDFFQKPFTEDTNVKLSLYKEYLKEWFPVFIAAHRPFKKIVNLFDFFCGPGKDSEGKFGSPLITLEILKEYQEHVQNTSVQINLYFNDSENDYIKTLKKNIEEFGIPMGKINIHFYNKDFIELFPELLPKMVNAANLIFLDQFGVKYVNEERFKVLVGLPVTDIIFFISSSTFNRFHNDGNVTDVIGLSSEEIQKKPFYEIHRLVHEKYSELVPEKASYLLAPFSIKKGTNIYGLIFGSGHPLGMEKFLGICWKQDEETGEANFDIQGDKKLIYAPSLFPELNDQRKIPTFQRELKEKILSGELTSDLEIFIHMINNGFIGKHVTEVINDLKSSKKIKIKYPSFKCSTVWKYNREPQKIEIL